MSLAVQKSPLGVRTLRTRLLLLAASGLVPLALMLSLGIAYLVEQRRAEAQRSALDISRALATAVDAELDSVAAVLETMGLNDELDSADFRVFYDAASRIAHQRGWRQVVLSDGEGRILMRTGDAYGSPAVKPVEPVSLAQAVATRARVVSGVVETPHHASDSFAVRVPVIRGDSLVYVLTGVLSTESILKVLTLQKIPAGSVAAVFDASGRRIARSREVDQPRVASPTLAKLLAQPGNQGVGLTTTREGIESHTGFTRLPGSGWAVAVGISVAETDRGLYTLLSTVGIGLAASLALSAVLAWVFSRQVLLPIAALKQGASALGRGEALEFSAMDIAELNDVADALKAAAADRDAATEERNQHSAEREDLLARITSALRAAEEAGRSKDQFLAMLGHELRNPLAPITTALQLMARKGDEKTAQERRIIERQLVHVTRLVDDLLDVSRITGRRLSLQLQPVRLAEMLHQIVESARPSLRQRALDLDLGPGVADAWVEADEVRLAQVFNNLLVNAIKFTPPGGAIRVHTRLDGGHVEVVVADTGVGIPPDELDRIFEVFYQAPQSSDRTAGGMGLGLPIVRSLVQMHGGTVEAASAGIGRGARFTVRFPLCEAPATPPSQMPEIAPSAGTGSGRILVVDDNRDAADTCAALLEISGYTVQVAYTPEAALETLRSFRPQVAILDIGLPGMSGHELAVKMRAHPAGFAGKLVALTGYGQAKDVAASHSAGFDTHLTKPVSPAVLLALVESLMGTAADPPGP
ncbi:MAG: response regulator [Comamonadaceae bacterium]|nr:MAG: response regulator [Comamonadaceae bacterium]